MLSAVRLVLKVGCTRWNDQSAMEVSALNKPRLKEALKFFAHAADKARDGGVCPEGYPPVPQLNLLRWCESGVQKGFLMLTLKQLGAAVCALAALTAFVPGASAQSNQKSESLLIETPKPYTALVSSITALGGKVTKQYQNIDAIAVQIPIQALGALKSLVGTDSLSKDLPVSPPRGVA